MKAEDTKTLISVRDLRVSFRVDQNTDFEAVKGITFDIPVNSTVALVGESGSGKSVTALAMMGLLPRENSHVHRGSEVLYRERNLLELAPAELRALCGAELSMIFQEPMTSLNPVFTVGFQLVEVLTKHLGMSRREARLRAVDVLNEVGIPQPETRINAYPFELSGGQQQRVMIAMAIACEPKLLIADEPTTALDVTIQKQILELIAALQKQRQMSVLFITHDLAVVGDIADQVIVMRDGEIREQGEVRQVFDAPSDAYTKALLQCRPQLAWRPWRLPVIEDFLGSVPGAAKDATTRPSHIAAMDPSRRLSPHPQPFSPGEKEALCSPPERGGSWVDIPQRSRGLQGGEQIVLEVRHLGKSFYTRTGLFGKKEFKAVKDVSFSLAKGKTLGLVGESGSGKTTVGLALMRLHEDARGEVLFDGRNLLTMPPREMMQDKRRIQIVFQNPYASLNPRFTVGQILMEPMRIHGIGAGDDQRRELAYELLAKVGLPEASFFNYPHEFSGGQRQRIAIARCLTMKPDVLICDESVSALDVSVQAQVLNLLQDLQDEFKLSYIFISHDLAVVKYMADEVMVMSEGEIVEIADSDEIYRNPQHPYTKKLLSAIPQGF